MGLGAYSMGPGWWFFGLIPLLFWGAIIGLIIALVMRHDRPSSRSPAHPHPGPPGPHTPPPPRQPQALSILEERYARGEISREEFIERRAVLLGVPATPPPPAAAPRPAPAPVAPTAPAPGDLTIPGEPPTAQAPPSP